MRYDPDVNDLLFMHAALVKQYGGSSGVRDAGALEAAVARPWGASFGAEHFPTHFDKAAALCESIIKRHPFVDGNKRTGTSGDGPMVRGSLARSLMSKSIELAVPCRRAGRLVGCLILEKLHRSPPQVTDLHEPPNHSNLFVMLLPPSLQLAA